MLGHYLSTLTPTQEDAVLTKPFVGGHRRTIHPKSMQEVCLVELTTQFADPVLIKWPPGLLANATRFVPFHYDDLCERFGEARVNGAIRARILENRARRLLTHAQPAKREEVTV